MWAVTLNKGFLPEERKSCSGIISITVIKHSHHMETRKYTQTHTQARTHTHTHQSSSSFIAVAGEILTYYPDIESSHGVDLCNRCSGRFGGGGVDITSSLPSQQCTLGSVVAYIYTLRMLFFSSSSSLQFSNVFLYNLLRDIVRHNWLSIKAL